MPDTIIDKYGHVHTLPGPYRSVTAIKKANDAAGRYFFSPDTMRFFRSRVEPGVYGGRVFITSEQFVGSDGTEFPRFWQLRVADDDGGVSSYDEREYDTLESAQAAARSLVSMYTNAKA
jgi:hypothetical protein